MENRNIDLKLFPVDINIVKKLKKEIAIELKILPLYEKNNMIYIAAYKKIDISEMNYLKFIYQKEVKIIYENEDVLIPAIKKYFNKEYFNETIEKFKGNKNISEANNYQNDIVVKEAPIVKITDIILKEAVEKNTSDIHFEPFNRQVKVRFRIDGILHEFKEIPKQIYSSVITRIKIMADMDISQKYIPSSGRINYSINKVNYDLRVSSIPTVNGEKIVIRILYNNLDNILLDNIGFDSQSTNMIKECIKCSNGMILVTGPTGSGKSTTLYAILNEINNDNINITTIEDPVEYNMNGINQINVNQKAGLTFAVGLKNILIQDPDVIMIGEIRDNETALISTRAALTGHIVLSTIHTKDSAGAVLRLLNMGVESYLIADTLITVIAQRLVRELCPYCKIPYYPEDNMMRVLNISRDTLLYKANGCSKCNNTGYKGRIVVCEVMKINEESREIIRNCRDIDEIRDHNFKNGMKTLRENAIELIIQGKTTYEELLRCII